MSVLAFLNHVTFQRTDGTLRERLLFAFFCTQGGGLFIYSGGSATLNYCEISGNAAASYGGGIYNIGNLTLTTTTLHNNTPDDLDNTYGTAYYVLPAPSGRYVDGVINCTQRMCGPPGQQTSCALQICLPANYGNMTAILPQQKLNEAELLPNCSAGFYANRTLSAADPHNHNQTSSICSGPCPAGFVCPEPGTEDPTPVHLGAYSTSGASQPTNCSASSFGDPALLDGERTSQTTACLLCPFNTTTLFSGATDATDCACLPNFFDDLGRDPSNATDAHGARFCSSCPLGFNCSANATTTLTAIVGSGFWRPFANATLAKPCPVDGTCAGGGTDGDALCNTSFFGTYCSFCANASLYLDSLSTECRSCSQAQAFYGRLLLLILATLVGLTVALGCAVSLRTRLAKPLALRMTFNYVCGYACACAPLYLATVPIVTGWGVLKAWARRLRQTKAVARLIAAAEYVGLKAKLKICLGLYLVLAQLGDVYRIRYPPDYQSVSKTLFSALRPDFLSIIPGLHLSCLGFSGIVNKLAVYICFPLLVGLLACGASLLWSRSVRPALPFLLFWTYFVFPSVSSHGFAAIARCDCFNITDGSGTTDTPKCYLPADYSYTCPNEHAGRVVIALGFMAIVVYGVGVPVLYALLLYAARADIRSAEPPPDSLAPALSFLHGALLPDALWWPLVDTSRTLLLTGVLALIEPGELIQIFSGVAVAICYLALQIWSAPFRMPGNNLLSLVASLALVLNLLTSLGIQFNSKYVDDAIDPGLLSVVLFVAGSAVLLATLLTLCVALSRRLTPEQLRQYLRDEAVDSAADGELNPQSVAPLLARFGEFTINADQLTQAFSAPLLTDNEVATLRRVALADAQAAPSADKYSADAAALLLSAPGDAARGLARQLGVTDAALHERMSRGVRAIAEEIEANGSDDDKHYLQLVLHEAADFSEELFRVKEEGGLSNAAAEQRVIDPGYQRRRLTDFVAHPKSVAAGLDEAHVAALRFYTTPAFEALNTPLRAASQPPAPHPFPATVSFIAEGIRRLRAVEAERAGGVERLWRGMRNVRADMRRGGGTEPAMLSCTPDLETAARFATSRTSFVLLVRARSFMQRGAELQFLSVAPHECEVCYPPCTLLKPTGRTQRLEINSQLSCEVVEVEPHLGS